MRFSTDDRTLLLGVALTAAVAASVIGFVLVCSRFAPTSFGAALDVVDAFTVSLRHAARFLVA